MVFLESHVDHIRRRSIVHETKKLGKDRTHLISERAEQILYGLAVVLPELAQVLDEQLVEPRVPIRAHDLVCALLECKQIHVFGVSAHDLEPIGRVLKEGQPPAWIPEVGV